MTLHRAGFYTYEVIASCNVHLGNDGVVQTIGMRSIVVEAILKSKINQIYIYNMLDVSKLFINMLSVGKLVSNGLKVHKA